ncbi:MAG TPA: SURF1 family protein, partial [Pseudoxanthomonas sp.]|nr:SURF1 family protein [Pseudoxanthomonas sp.]
MPLAFGWALALAAIALFCSLGVWQLSRGEQKRAMLAQVEDVLARRDARPLTAAAEVSRQRGYDWAAGEGRFLAAPAVLLDNQIREGRVGIRVYRAFEPAGGTPLLVEMGWLPLPADRRLPVLEAPPQVTRGEGLLAPAPSIGLAAPTVGATPQGHLLTIGLDRVLVAEALGLPALAGRVLKLDPQAPLGYARDLDILSNTLPPDRHLGYAVQWFGLALAVLVIALVMSLRRRG